MNVIIDTSSLLALVRYYLPFDTNNSLKEFIKEKFVSGELLIIDRVFEEASYISKGIILTELDFLNDKKKHIKTTDILPNSTFFNLLENQFCNKDVKKLQDITEVEFEFEKERYLKMADAKMILFALSIKKENPILVTEETKNANDNKLFKKLPDNCHTINIECCNLPKLFKDHFGINISDYLK
jgi:hypothetical protein